jgi:hypothetical protein
MRLFHRTSAAAAILRDGFRDGVGSYLTDRKHSGVWLSSVPLDSNAGGAGGRALLEIHLPGEIFREYEWVEEGKTDYREALIPAAVVNRYGPPRLVSEDEATAIAAALFGGIPT